MSIESHDPWLSPMRQAEFPTRLVLSTVKLHRRREKTFLVLAALALLSTVAMPLLGASLALDLNHAIATIAPGVALPDAELALGVLVMPLGMFAISLIAELYGRRRAYATALVGLLAGLAAIGLSYARDVIAGTDEGVGAAVALSLAAFVGHLVIVPLHSNMRRNAVNRRFGSRKLVSTLVALLATWTVLAFLLYAHAVQLYGRAEDAVIADIGRIVIGGAAFTAVIAILDVVPFMIVARGLATYLRVGRYDEDEAEDEDEIVAHKHVRAQRETGQRPVRLDLMPTSRPRRRSLPPAQIVDTPVPGELRRDKRTSMQPFSSGEMRFFAEGEELAEKGVMDTTGPTKAIS